MPTLAPALEHTELSIDNFLEQENVRPVMLDKYLKDLSAYQGNQDYQKRYINNKDTTTTFF